MVLHMFGGRPSVGALLALPLAALACSPASAAQSSATVTVHITKPLAFSSTGSLNFGTIVMNNLTAPRTLSLSPTNVLTCGSAGQLVCSGATSVPTYNVQGTNRNVINVFKNSTQLTNTSVVPVTPSIATSQRSRAIPSGRSSNAVAAAAAAAGRSET